LSLDQSIEKVQKESPIVPDITGQFFVMKQTIDVNKYHKWLVTEQPKPEAEAVV
jgi:hypothetical protein